MTRGTKDWSEIVDGTEPLVIVTPEYNHGDLAMIKEPICTNSQVHRPGSVSHR